MKTEDFNKLVSERVAKIQTTLVEKAKEYATDGDRLHNFNRAAQLSGTIREKALWGFAMKHYVSFMDILDDLEKGIVPSKAISDEKLGDLINYLILIEACIEDRRGIVDAKKELSNISGY